MDATKVRKSLEYIDELITKLEKDQGFNQTTWMDARRGHEYLSYVLNDIKGVIEHIEEARSHAEASYDLVRHAEKILESEPENSHLI